MSKVAFTTLANLADTLEVPTETVIYGSAKAWVNFNGTGTVAIRDSFNVTSITDNGTGDYTINMTTAMPSANFSALAGGDDQNVYGLLGYEKDASRTTSAVRIQYRDNTSAYNVSDCLYASVVVLSD